MAKKNRKARRAAAPSAPAAASPVADAGARWPRIVLIVGVGVLTLWVLSRGTVTPSEVPTGGAPGQVWSAEHGHWHDAP